MSNDTVLFNTKLNPVTITHHSSPITYYIGNGHDAQMKPTSRTLIFSKENNTNSDTAGHYIHFFIIKV